MTKAFRFYRSLSVSVLFGLLMFLPSIALAQITNVTDDQSTPTPGSGHDYFGMVNETVSPANGSVSFRLGVPVPPGRGLTVPFDFAYDSNAASHLIPGSNGSAAWTSNNGFGEGGWSVTLPMLSWTYATYTQNMSGQIYSCDYVANFVFQDPTGGRHFLGMLGVVDSYQQCVYTNMGQTSYLIGGDDLFYAVSTSFLGTGVGTVMVSDNVKGTAYCFNVLDTAQSTTAAFVEDRNGNRVSLGYPGSNPLTVNDTLGRPGVSLSTGPGSWAVSVSGLSNPYTAYWGNPGGTSPAVGWNYAWSDGYCNGRPPGYTQTTQVITSITLPNGQEYLFSYDPTFGLLSQITYPTGAWVKYTWGWSSRAEQTALSDSLGNPAMCGIDYDYPAISERQVSFDGSSTALTQYFTYSTNWSNSSGLYKSTTVETVDNKTGAVTYTTYQYGGVTIPMGMGPGAGLYAPLVPVESIVTYGNASNTTERVQNETWADQYMMTCKSTTDYFNGSAALTTRTQYSSGAIWPWSNVSVWDWNQAVPCGTPGSPPTPTRQTIYTTQAFNVQVYPANTWPNGNDPVFTLPTSMIICTSSGNGTACPGNNGGYQAALTTFTYDGSGLDFAEVTVGRDLNYNGNTITSRGNLTGKTDWLNTGGASPEITYIYDDTGQKVSMEDACGILGCSDMSGSSHITTYSYTDYNAYLSEITYPTTATGVTLQEQFTYNFADGQLASSIDVNNGQTTWYYYGQNGELFDRLTSISYPGGGSTTYAYNSICSTPASASILLSGGQHYTSMVSMDALCHITGTAITSDPQGYDYTSTIYDGHGRAWQVSNPYRGQSEPSYGFTTTSYDALGRVISVVSPDGSTTSTVYSAGTNQECSQVTDPEGVSRTLCSDALGRLAQVTENGIGATTYYTHDGLDDLVGVSQGVQLRSFSYDSLKRLLTATNPESGTTSYSYDANGNVATRQDARSITTTYGYDVLNRVTSKSYSDGYTPTASFFYDETSVSVGSWTSPTLYNPAGRLTHTTTIFNSCSSFGAPACPNGSSFVAATVQDYDPMGRALDYWQCTPTNCGGSSLWAANYTYDPAGDLISWNHPAGFTISQPVDGARHVMQVTSSLSDQTHPSTLAMGPATNNSIQYTAWGAVSALQNGCVGSGCTNTQETYAYNNRLQMAMAELGTASNPSADSCRVYNYYAGASNPASCAMPSQGNDNNGNVAGYYYNDNVNTSLSHIASYSYDGVNRLTGASATGNSTYSQNYSYDQYGNLSCTSGGPGCIAFAYNNSPQNNLITGYGYDQAGDVTNDGTYNYWWDGEGRLAWTYVLVRHCVLGHLECIYIASTVSAHYYNALNQRVMEVNGTTGTSTYEAYGAGGSLLWRYTGSSSNTTQRAFVPFSGGNLAEYWAGGTIFDHPDELGSATTSSDYTGNNFNEQLFYPFGQFWTGASLPSFGMQQTFAQIPDYDSESNQYVTLNRHYFPTGRWMSPDPGNAGADPGDPQTWNMYAYARGNPTTLTDPSGLLVVFNCSGDNDGCDQARDYLNKQLNGAFSVTLGEQGQLSVVDQKDVDVSKLSEANKALFDAITDKDKTATINIAANTGKSDFGDHVGKGVNTVDMQNLAHLGDASNAGGLTPGGALAHEIMDAWDSLSQPDTKAGRDAADSQASALFPGLLKPDYRDVHQDISSGNLNGQTMLQHLTNGKGAELVRSGYVKPIPLNQRPDQLHQAVSSTPSRVTRVTYVP